ncbi:MAG TPA: hypothetical protein VM263_09280, partial [Acidimicrobiales bacterium]|nr:hypothetical protein [Acidimicrobiales bacterium]
MVVRLLGLSGLVLPGFMARPRVDPDLVRPARWLRRRLVAQVDVRPDLEALPGGRQLQQLVDGTAAFALVVLAGAGEGLEVGPHVD